MSLYVYVDKFASANIITSVPKHVYTNGIVWNCLFMSERERERESGKQTPESTDSI